MVDWNKISFVSSGKRRTLIVLSLLEGPKTSKELAEEFKTSQISVLSILRDLAKEKIVKKEKNKRIYSLTSDGKRIAEWIRNHEI